MSEDEQVTDIKDELQQASEDLTPDEWRMLKSLTAPSSDDKATIFSFFNKIISSKDTTKTSNLEENELSAVRILKEADNYSRIMDLPLIRDFIQAENEAILGTALSKKGFLIEKSVTQKRELRTRRAGDGQKKGLFQKQEVEEE